MCQKERFLELIHDFIVFDSGKKKICRHNQYFGVKAAQKRVKEREGGIIWHTQGSGKSIVMVYLAKWLLENNPNARVAILTDRDELDKQIERVFKDAEEPIYRTKSGRDLMQKLGQPTPRLLCSLVHKFGKKSEDNFEDFIKELPFISNLKLRSSFGQTGNDGGISNYAWQPLYALGWNNSTYDDVRIKQYHQMNVVSIDAMLAWHVLNTSLPNAIFKPPNPTATSSLPAIGTHKPHRA